MTFACAHRGDSSRFRENTIAAVQSAIDAGAEIIEIDVRVSRDGKVIVLHDPTLERMWGLEKKPSEVDWSEIAQLGTGENRIPLLIDVLKLFVGTKSSLMIDMDEVAPAAPSFDVVKNGPLSQDQITWCGNIDAMRTIRKLSATARIWAPWDQLELPPKSFYDELKPEFVNFHYSFVDIDTVKAIHELGYKVSVWTVDDEPTMRWAAAIGVDSITTNYLSGLKAVLSTKPTLDSGGPKSVSLESIDVDRAMAVARELGKWAVMIQSHMDPGKMTLKKNAADIVTVVDLMVERHVREVIRANFVGHNFLGEEYGGEYLSDVPAWYLDPVDGTTNFANRMPWSSFSLALSYNRTPLVGVVGHPWLGKVFEAQRGKGAKCNGETITVEVQEVENPLSSRIVATELAAYQSWPGMLGLLDGLAKNYCTMRIMGSGTLTLTGVAANYSVGAVIGHFSPIDHLAAVLIVTEAGGVVLDQNGNENTFPESGGILCATKAAAKPLYEIWRSAIASA